MLRSSGAWHSLHRRQHACPFSIFIHLYHLSSIEEINTYDCKAGGAAAASMSMMGKVRIIIVCKKAFCRVTIPPCFQPPASLTFLSSLTKIIFFFSILQYRAPFLSWNTTGSEKFKIFSNLFKLEFSNRPA